MAGHAHARECVGVAAVGRARRTGRDRRARGGVGGGVGAPRGGGRGGGRRRAGGDARAARGCGGGVACGRARAEPVAAGDEYGVHRCAARRDRGADRGRAGPYYCGGGRGAAHRARRRRQHGCWCRDGWRLVRVTVEPGSVEVWSAAARAAGFRSVANWVRDALAGLYGVAVARPPAPATIDARAVAGRVARPGGPNRDRRGRLADRRAGWIGVSRRPPTRCGRRWSR